MSSTITTAEGPGRTPVTAEGRTPILSLERVVVLLMPLFGALATWIVTLVATNVPGAPHLDAAGIEGLEIAVFVAVAGLVVKWLSGRQQAQQQVHEVRMRRAFPPTVTNNVVDLDPLRKVIREEIRGEVSDAALTG